VSFLFPQLKTKLKGHRFNTIEMIEAELQAVLNTFTEHDFQDAFKKWQKHWEWCTHAKGDYFKGDGGQYAQSQFLTRRQHQSQKLWIPPRTWQCFQIQ
jgi:hypothetical protein